MKHAADEFLFVIVTVISVAPSPSGGLFATGSGDMRARIWRLVLLVFTSPHNFFSFFPSKPDRIILFLSPVISYSFFFFLALFYPTKPRGSWNPCPPTLCFSPFWCGMKIFRLDNLTDVWLLQLRALSPPSSMINIRNTNGRNFGTFVHVLNQIKHLREKSASRNVREQLCLFTFLPFHLRVLFSLLVCLEASIFFFPLRLMKCRAR